jgi:hypothetical protein
MSTAARGDDSRLQQSVRTILELLILAAVCWVGSTMLETQKQVAMVQVDVANIRQQLQLADVPSLQQRVTRVEARLDAQENRR